MNPVRLYPPRQTFVLFLLYAVIGLVLGACEATVETDLTLRSNERFNATSRVKIPIEMLVSADATVEDIENQFRFTEAGAEYEDLKFSWRREKSQSPDEIVYLLSLSGKGYDSLNELFKLKIEKTILDDKEVLRVYAEPDAIAAEDMEHTLRLHVGRILQTNNYRMDDKTILWTGTDTLEAIVIPLGDLSWPVVLIGVLATATLAGLVVVLFSRRHSVRQVAQVPKPGSFAQSGWFCPNCGQPNSPGAKFCMHCGRALPPRGS